MRALSQKLSKENHLPKKQKESSAKTVPLVQEEEPAPEEEEPLLLQRPERLQTLEELEELGKEDCLPNKELPRAAVEGEQMRRNTQTQLKGKKKKKEQMISLQNILTTRTPSVTSVAVPTTVEELVSRARVLGLWGLELEHIRSFLQHHLRRLVLLEKHFRS